MMWIPQTGCTCAASFGVSNFDGHRTTCRYYVPTFDWVHLCVDDQLAQPWRAAFKARVLDAIAAGAKVLILDMLKTGYIDTAGLGELVSIARTCKANGVRLIVAELQPEQLHLFHVARIDTLFEVVGTVQRARELLEETA